MKGLQEKSDSNAVFLAVKHHGIVEESRSPRDGFKPVEVKNPRTNETFVKYIKRYSGVEALINKIEWRDTGDQYETRYMGWKLHLDADGTPCLLDLPYTNGSPSRVTGRFMKVAENLDFSQPVEFRAWHDTKTDSTAFFIGQGQGDDGKTKSVPQRYTRDEPGDCPPPVQKRNGKWNFDDQNDYLHDRMMNIVIPAVDAAAAIRAEQSNGHYDESEAESVVDADEPPYGTSEPVFDDDEVPF